MEEVKGTGQKAMYDDDELAQLLQGRRLAPVTTCDNKTNFQAGQRELDARRVPADVQEQARALVSEHPKGFMAATFGAPTLVPSHTLQHSETLSPQLQALIPKTTALRPEPQSLRLKP